MTDVMKKKKNKNWSHFLSLLKSALLHRPKSRKDLLDFIRREQSNDILDHESFSMIQGVFDVSELSVKDIMIPRSQMVYVKDTLGLEDILPIIIRSAHSRFPVVGDNLDDVKGILLAKDLLRYLSDKNKENFILDDILRSPVIIPEAKRLNILLKEFRDSKNHMAIIVDEYGGVSGLVTIEDVLEQIVGDIVDEHDYEDDLYIIPQGKTSFLVKSLTPVTDFNDYFDTRYNITEFDTIGGLVLSKFSHLPVRDESVQIDDLIFTVLRADKRRIHLLRVARSS